MLAASVVFVPGAYVLASRRIDLELTRQRDLGRRHEKPGWEVWEYSRVGVMDRVVVGDEVRLLERAGEIGQESAGMRDVREVERVDGFEGVSAVGMTVGFVGIGHSGRVGIVGIVDFETVERVELGCLGRVDLDSEAGRVGSQLVAEADDLCSVVRMADSVSVAGFVGAVQFAGIVNSDSVVEIVDCD